MNRLASILALAIIALLSTTAGAQSLADAAKKEKERRAKNAEESAKAKVIDENELKSATGDTYSTTGESSSSSSRAAPIRPRVSPSRSTATSNRSSSASDGTTTSNVVGDRRPQCEAQLRKAEAEKKKLQEQFDKGVVEVATIDTTKGPKPPKGGIVHPRGGPQIGRDINGNPIYGPGGYPEAKVDVEGARVSCEEALRFPSRHQKQAGQCSGIKRKIEAADEEIRRARECLRSNQD